MNTARRSTPDERATTSGSENLARRSTELERAEANVAEEVNRSTSWLESREIIPTLVALRQRFENIRRAELTRLEPKLSALSLEARTRLDEITRLIVEKLLADADRTAEVGQRWNDEGPVRRRAEPIVSACGRRPGRVPVGRLRGGGFNAVSDGRALKIGTRGSRLGLSSARTDAAQVFHRPYAALPK